MFLRRLIDLSTSVSKLSHHIDISTSVRLDLAMWAEFLSSWNGVSFLPEPAVTSDFIALFTDAYFLGLGGFFQGQWLSHPWPYDMSNLTHIAVLELFAVFATISAFAIPLTNKQITMFTDNEAIVAIWSSGTSNDKQLMALVKELFFLTARHNISVRFLHVPGRRNTFADLLSRLQVEAFKSICPDCSPNPTIISPRVMAVLDKILIPS
ncbi:uncharacterized protein [Clytia hemisphaerica]|uniref:uncharacterized protein n=1 Tax=Clytia hemisphaerica TaxID=252671 RepID=UPI0034D3D71C